ncbi:MAG: nicotinamide riboside transporter PnuC [Pseudomonadales bacterium]|nr:nicotinamide mononucleotide transporter [Pseudomonadales bacterium]MCP5179566.1 nicotinamide mononucleotide transporter [Pseudomonadales bacterium]
MFNLESVLEIVGLVSGLACVWLLIRQNVLTFPLGLAYAVVSVVVMYRARLYSDVLLNAYYVVVNGYGWWHWSRVRETTGEALAVTRTPRGQIALLGILAVLGIVLLSWFFGTHTDAERVTWNATTTVLSFVAMWMSARKYLENWWLWLVVNILSIGLYFLQGVLAYALLYTVYLVMAVTGYRSWRASMQASLKAGEGGGA